ncbi:MAG: carboxypeptidase regulatory-like domain-containing protein [bacterium]
MKKIVFWIVFAINFCANVPVAIGGEIKGTVTSKQIDNKKDILVFIEKVDSNTVFHNPDEKPKMDQRNLAFLPHILPVVVGTTVEFPNNDHVLHNVFSPSRIKRFDLGSFLPKKSESVTFDKPGKIVVLCKIHPQMSAYIIVLQNPFFALTDEDGNFVISNIPAGTYRLSTWHIKLKTETKEVKVPADGAVEVKFDLTTGDPVNLLELLK